MGRELIKKQRRRRRGPREQQKPHSPSTTLAPWPSRRERERTLIHRRGMLNTFNAVAAACRVCGNTLLLQREEEKEVVPSKDFNFFLRGNTPLKSAPKVS